MRHCPFQGRSSECLDRQGSTSACHAQMTWMPSRLYLRVVRSLFFASVCASYSPRLYGSVNVIYRSAATSLSIWRLPEGHSIVRRSTLWHGPSPKCAESSLDEA